MSEENKDQNEAENGLMDDSNKENVKITGLGATGAKKPLSGPKKQIKKYYNPMCVLIISCIYVKSCPNAPSIPAVLIVYGLVVVLGFVWQRLKGRINQTKDVMKRVVFITTNLLYLLNIIIFITWIVVVYTSAAPDFDDVDAQNYCNRNVYLLALYLINTYLLTIAVSLLLFCCCISGLFLVGWYVKKDNDQK
ncbi:unnamed protein product [Medioppia subpectinata]|uniref:Uncharacterized protein n=1 Tax=Medioppia subpectinata TaxID=1979941 RepID=A0A7R9QB78_9ACAR|nr:unnamed protein product [Medioppia subpectinata]CAG2117383.1 unnamed protein product [Medioppia subpectinata]